MTTAPIKAYYYGKVTEVICCYCGATATFLYPCRSTGGHSWVEVTRWKEIVEPLKPKEDEK